MYQESLPELLVLQPISDVNTCQIEADYRFSHWLSAELKLEVLPLDLLLSMQLPSSVEHPAIIQIFILISKCQSPGHNMWLFLCSSNECFWGKCDGMRISEDVCFLFQRTSCTDIPIFLSRYHSKLCRSSWRVSDILKISAPFKFPFGMLGLASLRNTFNYSSFLLFVDYFIIL